MSLRHAVLGLLAELPGRSGYDLMKLFDVALADVWPATQSQLYGELRRLADDGLVEVTAEGPRGRKQYSVTGAGLRELRRWMTETRPRAARKDETMLRVFFLGRLDPDQAQTYLEDLIKAADHEHQELNALDAALDQGEEPRWDYWRLMVEYGKRAQAVRREWAEWALERLGDIRR